MTGRTAVMNLVVAAVRKGRRRIDVTDQTGRLASHERGRNVIHAVIGGRCFVGMTGGAGGRVATGNSGLNITQRCCCRTVVGMTVGTVA